MIEATCSACGTHNRIAESDVPVGAKFVACTSCKSRVPLPATATAAAKPPGIPSLPKLPTAVPAIPSIKGKPPAIPVGPPSVSLGPAGAGPIAVPPPTGSSKDDIIDLSDLPAPKRQSPLGGAQADTKPAPRSGLSAALDADLPAPKAVQRSPLAPPPAALDLDDLIGSTPVDAGADLPAPKARTSADLPAPKQPRAQSPLAVGGDSDLPAPKPRAPGKPLPLDLDLDLPGPRSNDVSDLPAPRAGGVADLPAPRTTAGLADLPTPVPRGPDLLTPKKAPPGGSVDLPMPKPMAPDLPAPKGFFDDLPQPAQRSAQSVGDDIAPKGFFDDLPQPARGGVPAAGNDIAPLGFFDDLPQPARGGGLGDDIAPLGFFDDLPQPGKGQRPGPMPTDDVAPKGFFDDLPQPALPPQQQVTPVGPAPRTRTDSSRGAIDLGDDPIEQIDLANESPADELQLEESEPPLLSSSSGPSASSFDDLDLSAPSAAPGARAQQLDEDRASGIKIGTPKTPPGMPKAPERASLPPLGSKLPLGDEPLELEEPRETQSLSQRLGPKAREKAEATKPVKKPVSRKLIAGIALGVVLAGGGGFFLYQRHAAKQAQQELIADELGKARKAMASDNANRWTAATNAANKVLEIEPSNGAAAGIASEAAFASALAEGKNLDQKFSAGRKRINDALSAGVTGPELDRAAALSTLTTNPSAAVTKLKALITKQPKDAWLTLYLAWAYVGTGERGEALKAYDTAAAAGPTKLLALLGRGRMKLDDADLDGATADYNAVLALQKENVPAQIGLAAALPAAQAQQQESDLLAIIARKDFADADPRERVRAYVLVGDAARRSNRFDAARERYRKALEIDKRSVIATTNLAALEIADRKLDIARGLVDDALKLDKNHVPALLVQAQLALIEKKFDQVDEIITPLEQRTPPLSTRNQVRVAMVRGKLLEAQGKPTEAVDTYVAAAKLAGDLDLAPTMAAIATLGDLGKAAAAAKDTAKEAEYRARADELLQSLATAAAKDPSIAFSLGIAYQQAGEPAQAEPWLRKVLETRPNDPDAMYQLAVVLRALGRNADALAMLEKAVAAAPERGELAMELARTFEALERFSDAAALYEKLLALPDPTVELREYAGLFYVRQKQLEKAAEQGKLVVAANRESATGHYLVGEGELARGNLEAARQEFTEAVSLQRTARHLDALGRAYEAIAVLKKDVAMQDSAIRSYQAAIELDPSIISSQIGLGRLYVARREMDKAIPPLLSANKLRTNDAETSYLLGAAYARKQETKVALQWMQQAARLEQSAETAYLLAQLYTSSEVNDGSAAAGSLQTAVRLAETENKRENKPMPTWYGDALYQLGDLTQDNNAAVARSAWEKWLALDPPAPDSSGVKRKTITRALATGLKR